MSSCERFRAIREVRCLFRVNVCLAVPEDSGSGWNVFPNEIKGPLIEFIWSEPLVFSKCIRRRCSLPCSHVSKPIRPAQRHPSATKLKHLVFFGSRCPLNPPENRRHDYLFGLLSFSSFLFWTSTRSTHSTAHSTKET